MKKALVILALFCAISFAQKSVKIGSQTWMAQDLEGQYTWNEAMVACPDGWHLPSANEWQTLVDFAGGNEVAGQKLKAKSGWEKWECTFKVIDDRGRSTTKSKCNSNNYGFSALPSSTGGAQGVWWTSSDSYSYADVIYMNSNSEKLFKSNVNQSKEYKVRCLKGSVQLPAKFAKIKAEAEAAAAAKLAAEEAEKKEREAELNNPLTTEKTEEGTILRGSTLAKKLAWLERNAESHNTYIVEISDDDNVAPHIFEYKGAINITIILRGDEENRTIRLKSHGTMFTVKQDVTFILDDNITLMGHKQNTGPVVFVNNGTFIMKRGSIITGNTNSNDDNRRLWANQGNGGGVLVNNGTFVMQGNASVSGNTANYGGGGVFIGNSSKFTLQDMASVSNNTATWGGGIFINNGCNLIMQGGNITGNNVSNGGGGIYVWNDKGITLTIEDGKISNNTANAGGGIFFDGKRFNFQMQGGIITSNTARENGGGIWVNPSGSFIKTGGTITGYNTDETEGNVVKDVNGTISRRGHAVYMNANTRKETTSYDNMSNKKNNKIGWDD